MPCAAQTDFHPCDVHAELVWHDSKDPFIVSASPSEQACQLHPADTKSAPAFKLTKLLVFCTLNALVDVYLVTNKPFELGGVFIVTFAVDVQSHVIFTDLSDCVDCDLAPV